MTQNKAPPQRMLKVPKVRSEKHRRFIASLPCILCGRTDVQAAHIRSGNGGGMGLKPSDEFCIPLCVEHHRIQGEQGEARFWSNLLPAAKRLATNLHRHSGDSAYALTHIIPNWSTQ